MWYRWFLMIILALSGCYSLPVTRTKKKTRALYDTIILDIAAVDSCLPTDTAVAFLKNKVINSNIARRVVVKVRSGVGNARFVWTYGDLTSYEIKSRQLYDRHPKDGILVIFVAYLDGTYTQGVISGAAGVQYDKTSFAIFRHVTDEKWEGVVLMHELGHVLGLAHRDNRLEDPVNAERPNHCNAESCTMFWMAGEEKIDFCDICSLEISKLIRGESLKKRHLLVIGN